MSLKISDCDIVVSELKTIFNGYMYDDKTKNIYAPCSNTVVGKNVNGKNCMG